jgi:glycosyltransferase involved in cell wall biosynthesis
MNPKVTIIMATYNRSHFIEESLQSIQNQSFENWECIIIDDGGTDNTTEIITPILKKDNRFSFVKRLEKHKKGLPGCRNYGLEMAKGEFIIFFDDDDVVHPENLKVCTEIFSLNDIDFCHYQKQPFDTQKITIETNPVIIKQQLTKNDIEKVLRNEIGLASCTVMWKRHCFEKIRFNENLQYAEEWECYSRIISDNYKGLIIDNILYYNRKHPDSNTGRFYKDNPIRRASNKEAILLVIQNLKEKKLITNSILHYFIQVSLDYKEYKLFQKIEKTLQLPTFYKLKWQLFFLILPLRLFFFGKLKRLKIFYKK